MITRLLSLLPRTADRLKCAVVALSSCWAKHVPGEGRGARHPRPLLISAPHGVDGGRVPIGANIARYAGGRRCFVMPGAGPASTPSADISTARRGWRPFGRHDDSAKCT